ncbi:MAG: sulfite exporter TauE/SafE family protein [Deltaproteobacteria bacterium]|nr:sulfite exporter TauE/SafE family protein [Deltaproteobacteria bacterium]
MDTGVPGAIWAAWLGILTSISPCPLATNIAAISYIGKGADPRETAVCGLAYTAGRMASYLALGTLLVAGLLSSSVLSCFLQQHMNRILGPVLILTGMILLELLSWKTTGGGLTERVRRRADKGGATGAGLLGASFALSFCPVSAALFFGSLIPLSLKYRSPVAFPLLFGAGTALPVLLFAGLISFGSRSFGQVYDRMRQVEHWGRRVTGIVFILAGIHYSMIYIFEVG